ncbi:hypothetical protein PSACC_01856 [Paramicrosporidium saccamoebae]|uniref:Uncharacterized protein n=1 Tax=Paramicrosporidium saccamoebae TaxID=1246581 RepID=A0A2H9TKL6_9FUNG|nr:hypothetical protein PSACC_01856 [Paramicrosporidium saccamoebae]
MLVSILYTLLLLEVTLGKRHPKRIRNDYYRSRFHSDYFKNELDLFHQFKPHDNSVVAQVLKACNVVLPYRTAQLSTLRRLQEAQRWKNDALRDLWSSPASRRTLIVDGRMAQGLVLVVKRNLLGFEDELLKPTKDVDDSSEGSFRLDSPEAFSLASEASIDDDYFRGPATGGRSRRSRSSSEDGMTVEGVPSLRKYRESPKPADPETRLIKYALEAHNKAEPAVDIFLIRHYEFIKAIYAQTMPDCALWAELYKEDTIFTICKMFYSPDTRERTMAGTILGDVGRRLMAMLDGQWGRTARGALMVLGTVVNNVLKQARDIQDFLAVRTAPHLIMLATGYIWQNH